MATIVMERLGHVFISLQQVRRMPQMLREGLPSVPSTLRASEVPPFCRVPHIHGGYRPLDQPWRCYLLSLFQRHNETVNVWTHLLGALFVLAAAQRLSRSVDFAGDAHAWPLLLLLASSVGYLTLSTLAHLLSARSHLHHHALYFLDYLGIALYQYGSAAAHLHYAAGAGWRGAAFPAVAALLAWISCAVSCWNKLRGDGGTQWGRILPCGLAYVWDCSPLFHRVYTCLPTCALDPAARLHGAQVACFLGSAAFFASAAPERWLPGRCDFLPQGHQLFHVLLVLGTCCQIRACHLDYLQRRALYAQPPSAALAPLLLLGLFVALALACTLTCVLMTRHARRLIGQKHKAM